MIVPQSGDGNKPQVTKGAKPPIPQSVLTNISQRFSDVPRWQSSEPAKHPALQEPYQVSELRITQLRENAGETVTIDAAELDVMRHRIEQLEQEVQQAEALIKETETVLCSGASAIDVATRAELNIIAYRKKKRRGNPDDLPGAKKLARRMNRAYGAVNGSLNRQEQAGWLERTVRRTVKEDGSFESVSTIRLLPLPAATGTPLPPTKRDKAEAARVKATLTSLKSIKCACGCDATLEASCPKCGTVHTSENYETLLSGQQVKAPTGDFRNDNITEKTNIVFETASTDTDTDCTNPPP